MNTPNSTQPAAGTPAGVTYLFLSERKKRLDQDVADTAQKCVQLQQALAALQGARAEVSDMLVRMEQRAAADEAAAKETATKAAAAVSAAKAALDKTLIPSPAQDAPAS